MQTLLSLAPTPHSRFPRGALVSAVHDHGEVVHVVYPGESKPSPTTLTGFVRLPLGVTREDPRAMKLAAQVGELGDFDIGQEHVERLVEIAFGLGS